MLNIVNPSQLLSPLWCVLQLIYNITSVVTPCWSLPLGITLHSTLGDKSNVIYTRILHTKHLSQGGVLQSGFLCILRFLLLAYFQHRYIKVHIIRTLTHQRSLWGHDWYVIKYFLLSFKGTYECFAEIEKKTICDLKTKQPHKIVQRLMRHPAISKRVSNK